MKNRMKKTTLVACGFLLLPTLSLANLSFPGLGAHSSVNYDDFPGFGVHSSINYAGCPNCGDYP